VDLNAYNRIVLFGGSFDPPHKAHIELPKLAAAAIHADLVAYIPTCLSPHKQDRPPTDTQHRLNMLQIALKGQSWATIVTVEVEQELNETSQSVLSSRERQPSYTVDTVKYLRDRIDDHVELRLLIGADQLRAFDQWKDPRRIAAMAQPLVMLRPPDTVDSLKTHWPRAFADVLPGQPEDFIVELPKMEVSSTLIRQRVEQGKPLTDLVHSDVERYIIEHDLYQS
jgi:nicotinate-nucleotide adenylyltransferase